MADEFNPTPRGSFDAAAGETAAPHFATPPVAYAPPAYAPPPPAGYGAPPQMYGYGYPPPAPRRSGWFWVAIIGGIFALIVVGIGFTIHSIAKSFDSDSDTSSTSSFASSSIAVIDVTGVILESEKTNKQLRKFGDDANVKAIVLHIDSPGGSAEPSQEIYQEVMRIRAEKHKVIVASISSMGASGAYYIASACDKIYAEPASVVGSIGVIMEWTNYGELLRWAKLKNVTITHGELKDAGDPSRDLTPKEQAYFQSLVDNMYTQFVHDVAVGRHTTDAEITPLATGQVWTGEQAMGLHLIDKEGGFRTALMDTAKDVGISGEPKIVRPNKEKHNIFATLNDDADDLFPNPSKLLNRAPGFYFLWK